MPRVPAAVRSLAPHRLALIAVVVTATLSATLLAALVSFAALVTGYAVRATLRSNPATGILVTAPATSAATAAGEFGQVRATVDRGLPGGPLTVAGSLSTDFLDIPAQVAGSHAQIHVISLPGPARYATLVAGAWPWGGAAASFWKKFGNVFFTHAGFLSFMPGTFNPRIAKHIAMRWSL